MAPHVRTVKTTSGATAVQIVHSNRRGSRDIEHIGSAHTPAEVELLKAVARGRLAAGQGVLDLDLQVAPSDSGSTVAPPAGTLPIRSSRMGHLGDALAGVFERLGFESAADGDAVFRALVLARIIEPTSKLDSIRVLQEAGLSAPSYRTIKRRLPVYAKDEFRQEISAACASHAGLGPASLVLYDVSVRHEALVVRAEVRDLCLIPCRSGGFQAGGSLTGETTGRVGAALTKPWRVNTVGWRGRGEHAEEVYARNRCHHLS